MDIRDYFGEKRLHIDGGLKRFPPSETDYPFCSYRAMPYSLFAGNKRLRPILALAEYEAVREKGDRIISYPYGLEIFDQKADPLGNIARFVLARRS